ncbi:unnamed protein product, partial [Trichobilharzia regenti]
ASVTAVEETRESHKSSTRKRPTPTTINSEGGHNLRYANTGVTANNSTATVNMNNTVSPISPGENVATTTSSRHHHRQSSSSRRQRASSGNSTESREASLENERVLLAPNSAGIVKKAKKGHHHHHHHQRPTLDSMNVDASASNPGTVIIYSTPESQSSSRHSRR